MLVSKGTRRESAAGAENENKTRMHGERGSTVSRKQSARRSETGNTCPKPSEITSKPTSQGLEDGEVDQIGSQTPSESLTSRTNREERAVWYANEGKKWAKECRRRDKYRCQMCGRRPRRVTVHHIFPFHSHPELRSEPKNGVSLCYQCHKAISTPWGALWNRQKQEESGLA